MSRRLKFPVQKEVLVAKFEPVQLAFEMREQIFRDGELIFDSEFYQPNALTNDGQAHMLNVWAREQANLDKYLMLLNMPGGAAPTKTSTLGSITEAITVNTGGYLRQQIGATDWSAPALDAGDEQIAAAQKTWAFSGATVPVSHAALASTASNFSGTLFLYVSTAYHTATGLARAFVSGESYLVTLRDKQT